jgi:SAM-dependent methyltransferase
MSYAIVRIAQSPSAIVAVPCTRSLAGMGPAHRDARSRAPTRTRARRHHAPRPGPGSPAAAGCPGRNVSAVSAGRASGARAPDRIRLTDRIYICRFIDVQQTSALFRLLSDSTRLRLLRVLASGRFNVTELTGILGVAQSNVSRHLGLLKDAGLLTEEREAGYVYYRVAEDARTNGQAPLWTLLDTHFESAATDRAVRADDSRTQEVLRLRKENFETHGDARQLVPGRSWAAWSRALGHLLPPLDVADIGCGEGYLTLEAARWARTVVGIDRSGDVLERAKALAARRHVTNVDWKKGDLAKLPLKDASVDVALLSQALHHAGDPARAVGEAVRVLRRDGRLLLLDLREHDQAWVRSRFGDRHLGFSASELQTLLRQAGLSNVHVQVGASKAGDPFAVLIGSGLKAQTKRKSQIPNPKSQRSRTANA